jgi:hypothetical protein
MSGSVWRPWGVARGAWGAAGRARGATAIVHEFPGPATRFRRAVPIERHRDVLALIDDVFTVIRTFVRPLAVEVTQVVMDSALGLPRPSVALDAASLAIVYEIPSEVALNWTGLTIVHAGDRPMAECIAPRYDAPPGHLVAAASGYLMASAARLPSFEGDLLPLETRTGRVNVPVRHDSNGVWVAGPLHETPTQPPIGASWSYYGGVFHLDIITGWSPWSEDPLGAYLVQQATIALVHSHWTLD